MLNQMFRSVIFSKIRTKRNGNKKNEFTATNVCAVSMLEEEKKNSRARNISYHLVCFGLI